MPGKIYLIGLILFFILLAEGCVSTNTGPTPLQSTQSITLSAGSDVTSTPIFPGIFTPVITSSLQMTETIVIRTPLSDGQIEENVIDSLKNNRNCQLPCWWGINPGDTSWPDANATLQKLGLKPSLDNISGAYTLLYSFSGSNSTLSFMMNLFIENGLVRTIDFQSEGYTNLPSFKKIFANLAPEQIMAVYGSPKQIDVTGGFGAGGVFYVISFYYDNLDFAISYAGKAPFAGGNSATIVFCPIFGTKGNLNGGLGLELVSGNETIEHKPLSHSLSEISGMAPQDLYDLYISNKNDVCFETPTDLWK